MSIDALSDALLAHCDDRGRAIDDRHWVFEVPTGEDRSQVVHVLYEEEAAGASGAACLILDSPIGPVPNRFDAERLLRRNAALHVGAICIEDYHTEAAEAGAGEGAAAERGTVTYLTLRATHLLSTLSDAVACQMLEAVARTADELEADLYGHDLH